MQANIQLEYLDQIPGTTTVVYTNSSQVIQITDLKQFYAHADKTIDLVEQRRLWIIKNKLK